MSGKLRVSWPARLACLFLVLLLVGLQAGGTAGRSGSRPAGAVGSPPEQRIGGGEPSGGLPGLALAARDTPRPPDAVPDRIDVRTVRRDEPVSRLVRPIVTQSVPSHPGVDPVTSIEDASLRTQRSQVFRNADGTRTMRLYGQDIHVRRPDGRLDAIDLTLSEQQGWLAPKMAPASPRFALRPDGDVAVRTPVGGQELALGPEGARWARPEMDGSAVRYPGVFAGVDLRVQAMSRGFQENLVLATPEAAKSLVFRVIPGNLQPRPDASGAIHLVDRAGKPLGVLSAGAMRDAAGAESVAVRYQLDPAGTGAWRLRVEPDEGWLRDPARVYPVVVAQSAGQFDADAGDTYVRAGDSADRSGAVELQAGSADGGRTISRSYLPFADAMSRLSNQYVRGVVLSTVNIDSASCEPRATTVFEVSQPWSPATMRWPGAEVGEALSTQSFAHGHANSPCAAPARVHFPIDAGKATGWTHGAPFHGLSVRAGDERDSLGFRRFASANAVAQNRPYLDVVYSAEGAAYRVTSVTLPDANPGHRGEIRASVTNLGSSVWNAGGGFRLGFILKRKDGSVVTTSQGAPPTVDIGPGQTGDIAAEIRGVIPGTYDVQLTMFDPQGRDFHTEHGVPYGTFELEVKNVRPTTNRQQPAGGSVVETLTPTLYAEGTDPDNWPNTGFRFKFRICTNRELTESCHESDWTGQSWTPPRRALRWNAPYFWSVKVHDNVDETGYWPVNLPLSTRVPQPQITSHLAGRPDAADGPGLDPQVGNFAMVTGDASVPTVGPDLTVTRTYNSLDPRRDTAFGAGWASRLDMRLKEDADGEGGIVLTYPSGRQVRLGRDPDNPDGSRSYASPTGQNLTLLHDTNTQVYTLRDATGGTWRFDLNGKLMSTTDSVGRVETLKYDGNYQVETITNETSQRRLVLRWQGKHVRSVTVDAPEIGGAPLVWTYTYDGDKLTQACVPGAAPNCTTYDYAVGSHYRSAVADDNPRAYWRLAENDAESAANAVARQDGADAGRYRNVVHGAAGAVGGTADKAATFDGNSSYVTLPENLVPPTMSLGVELWFKTTAGGVLLSHADQAFPAVPGQHTPVLYVGTDGRLYGGFAMRDVVGPRQVVSRQPVNDDRWHHVVLSAAVDRQTMFLDGTEQGGVSGFVDHGARRHLALGAGSGRDWPATNGADFYFQGSIDEVALYLRPLGALAAKQHFEVGAPVETLTKVHLPQDNRVHAELTYDDVQDRVRTLRDHTGRLWTLDTPVSTETVSGETSTARRTVTMRGPHAAVTTGYDRDNGGRLVEQTREGLRRSFDHNSKGFLSATIDENGLRTEQTTDDRGNVLSRKACRAPGTCFTSYSTYVKPSADKLDPRTDKLESISDGRASGPDDTRFRTVHRYDQQGRLIETQSPAPHGSTGPVRETHTYSTGTEAAVGGGTVPAGLMIKKVWRRGQTTTFGYYRNGDLAEEVSPAGLRKTYTYDLMGRAKTATEAPRNGGAFGTTTYRYTPRSEVESVTEPEVTNPITNIEHAKVTSHRYDGNGNVVETTIGDVTPTAQGGDPARTTTFRYDAHDRLIATRYQDGGEQTRSYENAGLKESVTDVRGFQWTTEYDNRGLLASRSVSGKGVDPMDSSKILLQLELRNYDPAGRLDWIRDAMGRVTVYRYYDNGLVASTTRKGVVDASGANRDVLLEQRGYDGDGNVTELVTAGGRKVVEEYDAAGYVQRNVVDPGGLNRATTYFRDRDGYPTRVERTGTANPTRTEVTEYTHDGEGRVTREDAKLADGVALSTVWDRDERGLVRQHVDRRVNAITYTYDATGKPVSTTHPAVDAWVNGQRLAGFAGVETLGRNTFGEVTHARDTSGGVTRTDRDMMGRATAAVRPDYTPPGGEPIRGAATRTDYDRAGNPVKVTDELGRVTENHYDAYGRVTATLPPKVGEAPNVISQSYTRNGELAAIVSPSGAESRYTYDELGHRVTSTAVERVPGPTSYFVTKYGYDDAGNLTSTETPLKFVSRTAYNAADEPIAATDATGRTTTTGYDDAGRATTMKDPAGVVTQIDYDLLGRANRAAQSVGNQDKRASTMEHDGNGNVVTTTTPEGRRATRGYDALNRPVTVTERVDAASSITVSTGYDLLGNRSRTVDGEQRATNYTFNPWGLPESVVEPETATTKDPATRTWITAYDKSGQVATLTAPGGVTRTREYDAQGRLTVERGAGAEAPTADRGFGYDPDGRTIRVSGPAGDQSYTYDDRGNLRTAGTASYDYDGDGRLASRTDATGTAMFGYDGAGRLTSVVDPVTGRTLDRGYDQAGRLSIVTDRAVGQRVTRRITYDELSRVDTDRVEEAVAGGGTQPVTLLGVDYDYDRDDRVKSKTQTTNQGSAVNNYDYDGAGRLTSWTGPGGMTRYGWDAAGNRTSVNDAAFSYDERNRLRSGAGRDYSYSARGTLESVTENGTTRRLTFDAFDRMVTDGGTKYRYDGLDRVADRNGRTFEYQGMSNDVVSDGARQVSRLPDGTALSDKGTGTAGRMLFADGHGDVIGRYLGAATTGMRSYDPFGQVLSSVGEASSVGYQGDWTDTDTNKVNMTARWYEPGTARFASRDDWNLGAGANRYSYGGGDPIGRADPSGHVWIVVIIGGHVVLEWVAESLFNPGVAEGPGTDKPIPPGSASDGWDNCRERARPEACGWQPSPAAGPGPGPGPGAGPGGGKGPGGSKGSKGAKDGKPKKGKPKNSKPKNSKPKNTGPRTPRSPQPPPPPHWVTNANTPIDRPAPGEIFKALAPSPTEQPTLPDEVHDKSDEHTKDSTKESHLTPHDRLYLKTATELNVELHDAEPIEEDDHGTPSQCGARVNYGELNERDQATGIAAFLCGPLKGGTKRGGQINVPGYEKGKGLSRAHLLANDLGGSGQKPENFVALYHEPVNNTLMGTVEKVTKMAVENHQDRVYYKVTPRYENAGDLKPSHVDMFVVGARGLCVDWQIENSPDRSKKPKDGGRCPVE